jgi:mRNA interferase HigB
MTVFGSDVLDKVGRRNKPLARWLRNWTNVVEDADWQNIDDLREDYPSVDGVSLASGTVVTVFNVKGNQWRLLTWIRYDAQIVEALDVVTHAEYNKNMWKQRY